MKLKMELPIRRVLGINVTKQINHKISSVIVDKTLFSDAFRKNLRDAENLTDSALSDAVAEYNYYVEYQDSITFVQKNLYTNEIAKASEQWWLYSECLVEYENELMLYVVINDKRKLITESQYDYYYQNYMCDDSAIHLNAFVEALFCAGKHRLKERLLLNSKSQAPISDSE